jgi:hypothetical protein
MQYLPNPRQHTLEVLKHLVIPETQYADTLRFEIRRSFSITFFAFLGVVLSTVQFDRQFGGGAIEIEHETTQRVLFAKLETADLLAA